MPLKGRNRFLPLFALVTDWFLRNKSPSIIIVIRETVYTHMKSTTHKPAKPNTEPRTQKTYTVTTKQTKLIKILFKFRFITVPLLAHYPHATNWSTLKSLHVLTEWLLVAVNMRPYTTLYVTRILWFFKDSLVDIERLFGSTLPGILRCLTLTQLR